jgi:DivIVA domain-containing protein
MPQDGLYNGSRGRLGDAAMERALTPDEIRGADFTIALRGYDRHEVEAFLQDVAAEFAALKDSSSKSYQAVGEELGQLLQQSKDVADKLLLDAQNEAAALLQNAADEAAQMRQSAEAYANQLREEIDNEVALSRAEADHEFKKRISDADTRVQELSVTEVEIRQRIDSLRGELLEVAERLLHLGIGGSPPAEPQQSFEGESDQLQSEPMLPEDMNSEEMLPEDMDSEDTIRNGAVPAPPLGSTISHP